MASEEDLLVPPDGELGDFIAANMVAAVLGPIPEPVTMGLLLVGSGLVPLRRRSRS